ncbi:MAG: hypothetical protein QW134_10105 [Nitrososphaeria archaeon]
MMQINLNIDWTEFVLMNYIDVKYAIPVNLIKDNFSDLLDVEKILKGLIAKNYVKCEQEFYCLTKIGKEKITLFRQYMLKKLTDKNKQALLESSVLLDNAGYFLQYIITKFQLNADGQSYIIKSLEDVHKEILDALKNIISILPHLNFHLKRMENALSRVKEGNMSFIIYDSNSYYYCYSELHADIKNFISEIK